MKRPPCSFVRMLAVSVLFLVVSTGLVAQVGPPPLPVVTITSPLPGAVVGESVAVTVVVTHPEGTLVTLERFIPNGQGGLLVGSQTANAPPGGGTVTFTVPLIEGYNGFHASAQTQSFLTGHGFGNVTRDTIAPAIVIDSPLEGAVLATNTVTVTSTVTDATAATVTFGSNSISVPAGGGPASGSVSLVEGSNTITVTATDAAGHVTTAERHVTYTAPPVPIVPSATITSPASPAVVGASFVDVTAVVINAGATTVVFINDGVGIAPLMVPAGGGVVTGTVPLPVEGLQLIKLDVVANATGEKFPSNVLLVTRDTIPPEVTIDSPLEGAILATPGVPLTVTVTDVTETTVVIAGNMVTLPPGGGQASANLVLPPGLNAIQVTATDAGGNSTTATRNVVVDLTAPVVTISSPLNGATFGLGESPILVAASVADESATTVASNPAGIFANLGPGGGPAFGTIALTEGMNTIEVAATDALNRLGQAFVVVNLDTTAPDVTIDSPALGANLRGVIDLHVNAVDILPGSGVARIDLLVDGNLYAPQVPAPYEIPFPTTTLPDGLHVFTAVALDGKGNTSSVSVTARVDNTPPSVSIENLVDGAVRSGNVDFVAHATDDGSGLTSVLMRANGAPPTIDGSLTYVMPVPGDLRTSQVATTMLPDGSLLLTAAATDAAGNEATASVTIVVDNTAPQKMLITPTDGSVVSGALLIQAGWNDPSLATLSLYLDGVLVLMTNSSSLVTTFPTTSVMDGPLEVKIVALDLAGNVSTNIAMVTIDNIAVRIDPQTLNLKSKGGANSVTARVTGVNVGSLIPTEAHAIELRVIGGTPIPSATGWSGDDAVTSGGVPELAVKFDRQALIAAIRAGLAFGSIPPGGPVTVTLVAGGRVIGTDSVRIAGE